METTPAAARRGQLEQRLRRNAIDLTVALGFDGWTVADLAARADVSRRTVFNYFTAKADVVLGPPVQFAPERVAVFAAGGPTGRLLDDAVTLAADLIASQVTDPLMARDGHAAALGDPCLVRIVHERVAVLTATFVDHVRTREGTRYDYARARLAGGLIRMLFDASLERLEAHPSRPLVDHFADALADCRDLVHGAANPSTEAVSRCAAGSSRQGLPRLSP